MIGRESSLLFSFNTLEIIFKGESESYAFVLLSPMCMVRSITKKLREKTTLEVTTLHIYNYTYIPYIYNINNNI